jgi:rhodanese-related sulfurtransferase
MLQKKDFFFVNVHIPYQGEIGDTDVFIPYDKIAANLDKLPQDRKTPIVLYCLGGGMSEIAAQKLVSLGYSHVSHLSGGMIEWKERGYPIINRPRE